MGILAIIMISIFFGFMYFLIRLLRKQYKNLDSDGKRDFWIGFIQGLTKSGGGSSRNYDNDDYGNYVIQYRDQVGSSWIDGPGSNNEQVAESMFDRFLANDPRAERRCRLVKKKNGRVVSVLSTN